MEDAEYRRLALAELPAVYGLAHHLCTSPNDVDDVVQDTYLHALNCRSSANFQLHDFGLRPWLFKILHNVINARYGQLQRETEHLKELQETRSDALRGEYHDDGHPVESAQPDGGAHRIDWNDVDERLKRAIETLPGMYRMVFLLSAVEGLRYREIAEVIAAPVGTVMSRLHRAREMLAAQLHDLARERGLSRRHVLPENEMNRPS